MEDIAIMKKLVSDFVDTFMGTPNTYPLTKASADDIVDYFRALLMEDYRPEEIVPMRPAHATA